MAFARDFTKSPYSDDEKRIVNWLHKISSGDIGGGDDPIGFFMASYEMLIAERKEMKLQINALTLDNDRLAALMQADRTNRDLTQESFDIASEYARQARDEESGC